MDLSKSTALEVKLIAVNDGDAIRERTVRLSADGPLTIGRASSNRGVAAACDNTKIENKVISKEHALIRTDSAGENVFLKDLKSMHGTKVDGVEVPRGGEVRLVSGAELQFGVSVTRGTEEYKPAMYELYYQFWDSRTHSPSPDDYEPAMDEKVELKRGYTDGVSLYSDCDEDDACVIMHDTYYEDLKDDGEHNCRDNDEPSSLFGEISEASEDDSYSEGEPEPEVDYPEESEDEDESDSDSGESTYHGSGAPRSTTPPGGPVEIDVDEEEVIKAPEILKRFQNSISDLVDQDPIVSDVLENPSHHKHVEVQAELCYEENSLEKSSAEAAKKFQCDIPVARPEQENFVEAHQKVDDLIADALAEVKKTQESTSVEPKRPRPQKRTADQAELDDTDTPNENAAKDVNDCDAKVQSWPAETLRATTADSPRKRSTAQFLRSFARDTTIFAAGSLAMLVGLAKLPNSLAP